MASSTTTPALAVYEAEKRYWQATQDRDFETMRRLTADPFTLVQGEGIATFGPEDFAKMIRDGDFRLTSFQIDEDSVRYTMLGDYACFVAYRVDQHFERRGTAGSATSCNTSVLTKGNAGWQRAAHTISLS